MEQIFLPEYTGPIAAHSDAVLSEVFGDVTEHASWSESGYTALSLPGGRKTAERARLGIEQLLFQRAARAGLTVPDGLSLGKYHTIPKLSDKTHIQVAKWGVPFDTFGVDRKEIVDFISCQLGRKMQMYFLHDDPDVKDMCGVRVIRPHQRDHNPFHRDGWFPALRQAVTLWIPIAHCDHASSLRIFPGSHRWPESDVRRTPEGAQIGHRKFNVPALVAMKRRVEPIQPVSEPGCGLLFSSFLIHGGGENLHQDCTRVSFELRFVAP